MAFTSKEKSNKNTPLNNKNPRPTPSYAWALLISWTMGIIIYGISLGMSESPVRGGAFILTHLSAVAYSVQKRDK